MDLDAAIAYYAPPAPVGADERPDFTSLPLREEGVHVVDMRGRFSEISLDLQGFALVPAPTRVRNFHDRAEVMRVYIGEADAIVRGLTGCSATAPLNAPLVRVSALSGARPAGAAPTGDFVHADLADWSAEYLMRRNLPEAEASARLAGRFAIYNIWRTFSGPPQDMPLGLCDARTVAPADKQACSITLQTSMGQWQSWENLAYRYSAAHRWWWCSDMTREEAFVFRSYDSGGAEQVPHAAFANPLTAPDVTVKPRASIELRLFAFWDLPGSAPKGRPPPSVRPPFMFRLGQPGQGVWWMMKAPVAAVPSSGPTAQASPDGSADTPLSRVSPPVTFGVETKDQAVPFQCSVCVTLTGIVPLESTPIPMAQMSAGPAALMPFRRVPAAGLATIDQAVPFQCSMTAWSALVALVSCTLLKLFPTAQALVAEIAVTSFSAVGSAALAVRTIDQAVPSQCSASVKRVAARVWVTIAVVVPTAQMSVGDRAEMPVSDAFAKLVPAGTAGTGTETIDQAEPSQCSASGRASLPWPTAQALAGLRSATSYRDASRPPFSAAGVGTMVHAVPSQCAASALWLAALIAFELPTAQASLAPLAETPSSRSSTRTMFGVGTCCHFAPFQRSARICAPASSPAPWNWPTAQASVAVRAETALRTPWAGGLAAGTTVQAGVAAVAVLASRRMEPEAARAAGMRRCRTMVLPWYSDTPIA
jgi:hypothetical protein